MTANETGALFAPTPEAMIERLALIAARAQMASQRLGGKHSGIGARAVRECIVQEIAPMLHGKPAQPYGSGYLPPFNYGLQKRFWEIHDAELRRLHELEIRGGLPG